MDVGIRELKSKLSEYVARAARGETIRITERGKPKAVLGPLTDADRLHQGIEEGWIRPGSGAPIARVKRVRGERSIADVLAEDRGE